MPDISKIDANLKVESNIDESDIRFYDINRTPFKIHGVFYENGKFRRIPEDVAKCVSVGVYALHANTAGGRVRFKTDSPYVAIHSHMTNIGKMSHFALTGSAGFDLYVRNETEAYFGTFVPPYNLNDGYESIIRFNSSKMREITINFPLYSDISEMYIGVKENSLIHEPSPYNIKKPIVYYGSSITQGGCASRPGNSYQSIISRRFNADYINLGFSGNAKGEQEIAEYIKKLNMSVFVYDYDYNSPSIEHFKESHEKMFLTIREANPFLPIIMMSRPKYCFNEEEKQRFDVIKSTYDNAILKNDKNVYLIDGKKVMESAENNGTVDGCHPNDWGFMSMAKAVGDVIQGII